MPSRRFDWHEHLVEVSGEYKSARAAVDHLQSALTATPDLLERDRPARDHLRRADQNLEGTYIVRLFAAFEAALRSYDRARHQDPTRQTNASTLIDETAGKRGRGIQPHIREGNHTVRRLRNFWAHDADENPGPMTMNEARARLQVCLSELPDEWG